MKPLDGMKPLDRVLYWITVASLFGTAFCLVMMVVTA